MGITHAAEEDACGCGATAADVPAEGKATSEVEALLDRIEAAAAGVKSLRAKVRVETVQGLVGDEQRRFGTLWHQAGPPGRFALHLERVLVDAGAGKFRADPLDRWYVFDGVWLLERNVDEKVAIRRQIVPPDQDPAAVDPLGLGGGPFVLPLRAKKADLLKRFEVVRESASVDLETKGDAKTLTLVLTPREGSRAGEDPEKIVLTYDAATFLPTRAASVEKSGDATTIVLMESHVNADARIEAGGEGVVFDTSVPTEAGWQVDVRPWGQ